MNARVADMTLFMSQRRASPLAFHGDTLVQSVGGAIVAWDASTMQRTNTWALPHRHFCIAPDGTVTTFGFRADAPTTVIQRVTRGTVTMMNGPILPRAGSNVVLPGRAQDDLFVSAGEHIYALREQGGAFDVESILDHPFPGSASRDQWAVLGVRGITPHPPRGRALVHLVAATRERIWYSFATTDEDWNAHTLVLARADEAMSDERTVDVAPGRIVHLASRSGADGAAAALVITLGTAKATWSIVVVDERGHERWRADVPDEFGPDGALDHGFLALGDHRVVLASPDGTLLAWDAANGRRVG